MTSSRTCLQPLCLQQGLYLSKYLCYTKLNWLLKLWAGSCLPRMQWHHVTWRITYHFWIGRQTITATSSPETVAIHTLPQKYHTIQVRLRLEANFLQPGIHIQWYRSTQSRVITCIIDTFYVAFSGIVGIGIISFHDLILFHTRVIKTIPYSFTSSCAYWQNKLCLGKRFIINKHGFLKIRYI